MDIATMILIALPLLGGLVVLMDDGLWSRKEK